MLNAKCEMLNAKCEMLNAKCAMFENSCTRAGTAAREPILTPAHCKKFFKKKCSLTLDKDIAAKSGKTAHFAQKDLILKKLRTHS